MRTSKTLKKLRAGEPVRMCCLGHHIPAFVHHAAHRGFDCIWLDLEHRLIGEQEVAALLTHFHLADIDCMVRPATLEKTGLYRCLEDGAAGLMIPHVSTAEKAKMLVDAVKFPPLGDRGLDGAGLDADYLFGNTENYIRAANQETFLVVQIETLEAIDNIEEIAAVDGVDGLFVGTGDLGMRLRIAESEMSINDALKRVAEVAQRYGRAWGCPAGDIEQMKKLHGMGAQLLAHGSDFKAVIDNLDEAAGNFDEISSSTR
ncbi:MAG TPA: 4-hydroxy-2-oxovalerate aldolase [Verrucomicrobiales bacterium]|nr:4-hydroxy-2-oxovalerate aldolase [Verrucomicrobiales bacterium]HIL72065.1 4-hydroxy-2-oxovalerate aldolase [Verrucomicrobiota bacterium]